MSPAPSFRTVDDLFATALERPAEERGAFLARAAAGDPALRQAVERLLDAADRGRNFLEQPVDEACSGLAGDDGDPDPPGTRLGPFRLAGRIDGGGTCTVHLAFRRDGAPRERYAVKILRRDLDGTEARRRFLAERAILASLDHPHIARLVGGGIAADGRPFLAMELVEGQPIDRHCDDRALGVDPRLGLFALALGAVAYAHGRHLVHRDLKPANLLVTAAGVPKLLDFGIAKSLPWAGRRESCRTKTGVRLMTPGYASPEQIQGGPVTPATDVYTLGVLLYELLTGRSPYRRAHRHSLPEMLEAICHHPPLPPSQAALDRADPLRPEGSGGSPEERARLRSTCPISLSCRLTGPLDRILLRALAKNPRERQADAAELARDLASCRRDEGDREMLLNTALAVLAERSP